MAKTDRLDAHLWVHFAVAIRPEVRPLPDATTRAVSARAARRGQLQDVLTTEQGGLVNAAVQDPPQALREQIDWLRRHMKELDDDQHQQIRSSPVRREGENLLRRIPEIGPIVSATLGCMRNPLLLCNAVPQSNTRWSNQTP